MRRLLIGAALASVAIPLWFMGAPDQAGATFPGPNGRIAFSSTDDPPNELSLVKGDNSVNHPISFIAFGEHFVPDTDIWIVDPDGSDKTNITPDDPTVNGPADWSADGSKLVFVGRMDPDNREVLRRVQMILVMNANGSNVQRIATDGGAPVWSPDGARIVFQSGRTGNLELFVMDADGTNVQQLTDNPGADVWPQVSPDGKTILFASNRTGAWALYAMPAAGGTPTKLTADSLHASQGDYSPDGGRIVFANNVCATCAESDIFVMRADGQAVTQLTKDSGNNLNPKWSPDGTKIVFWSAALRGKKGPLARTSDIFVMNADGSGLANLTNSPGTWDLFPDWGT